MSVPQKNEKVTATISTGGNQYLVQVASNGPEKGKIISVFNVTNNSLLSYTQANQLYQANQSQWNTNINQILKANNAGEPGTAPTVSGLSPEALYTKQYNQDLKSLSTTDPTGGALPSDVAATIAQNKALDNLTPKNIPKPPTTKGKIYVFPADLNVGKTNAKGATPQDYIRIGALRYTPPNKGLLDAGGIDKSLFISPSIVKKGLASFNSSIPNYMEFIGEIVLPMPMSITDGAKAEWGVSKMSMMGASMAAAVSGVYNEGLLGGTAALANAMGVGGETMAAGALGKYGLEALLSYQANAPGAAEAFKADLTAQIVSKVSSTPVNAGDLLTRSTGAAVNPNAELLFRAPSLRTFDMQWKLAPRSEKEASQIRKIIRFLKINMLPTIPEYGAALLQSPNVFVLRYEKSDGSQNASLPKPKLCALGQVVANHTPDGIGWAAYDDSHPVATTLQMSFLELTPLLSNDFSGIPEDDVGL